MVVMKGDEVEAGSVAPYELEPDGAAMRGRERHQIGEIQLALRVVGRELAGEAVATCMGCTPAAA